MALNLKKTGKPAAPSAAPSAAQSQPQQSAPATEPVAKSSSATPSWAKRGDETQTAIKQEDRRIEAKFSSLWRFWLEKGESALVTFVDGPLTPQGILDCFMYREHQIYMNGKWTNWFVCTSEVEPCPICEGGDEPSLVGVFTVIDHREVKGKKGVYKDVPKLFVAKRGTIKQLQALATAPGRNGLAGCTFNISRLGEQAANVGDTFDFQQKRDPAELRKLFVKKVKDDKGVEKMQSVFAPANYAKEATYLPAAELRKLGFGKGTHVGGEPGPSEGPATASAASQLG